MAPWLIALAVSAVISVGAAVITPKPKAPKPPAVAQGEAPTASAGKPVPVVFGTVTIKEVNILWYGDKGQVTYQVSV
jgi:hypothetical protein